MAVAVVPFVSVAVTVMVFCPSVRVTLLAVNVLPETVQGTPFTVTPVSFPVLLVIVPMTVVLVLLMLLQSVGAVMVNAIAGGRVTVTLWVAIGPV